MREKTIIISFIISILTATGQSVFNFDGELLKYNAKYGAIKGGEVVIKTNKVVYNKNECYDVTVDMYAVGIVDDIFKFHDIFRSIFSINTLKPYKFIRNANEGKYSAYEEVDYYDNYVESTLKGRFQTNERYYDIVSGIFALRSFNWDNLNVNDVLVLPVYFDEKIFNIRVIHKGKERLKLNRKYYNCRTFVPIFSEIKMFSKEGIYIYLSDDYRRRPILIKVNFRVGSFKVELVE